MSDDTQQRFDLSTPRNPTEALAVARAIAKSGLAPKEFAGDENKVFVAMVSGARFGMDPFQSVQSIAVINGRPMMWGDAVLAVVRNSSMLDEDWPDAGGGGIRERSPEEALSVGEGLCEVKRRGSEAISRKFTVVDAEKAGLIQRSSPTGPWNTYRGRMLQLRARSWALRDAFPDVLKGLRVREEEEDVILDATTRQPARHMPRMKEPIEGGETLTPQQVDGLKSERQAPPKAAPPAAPESKAEASGEPGIWEGLLDRVESKPGTRKGKDGREIPYTVYLLHRSEGGPPFGCFSESAASDASSCASQKVRVRITHQPTAFGPRATKLEPLFDEPGANG